VISRAASRTLRARRRDPQQPIHAAELDDTARWLADWFLAAQALQIVGGCGSPFNPIAVQ
jgi:hypothetical protein